MVSARRFWLLMILAMLVLPTAPAGSQVLDRDWPEPCMGPDDPFCGSGGGDCLDGCWKCEFFILGGWGCAPVDGEDGRCECNEWVNPWNETGSSSCRTKGEYCFGVTVEA